MCPLSLHLANNGVRWPRKPAGNNNDHDVSKVVRAYSALTVSHLFLNKFWKPGRWVLASSSAERVIVTSYWKMGPSIILSTWSHSHIFLFHHLGKPGTLGEPKKKKQSKQSPHPFSFLLWGFIGTLRTKK